MYLWGSFVAIGLVAVPTAFTVFPTWATWPTPVRAAILVAWLAVAITGVVITNRANKQIRHFLELEERRAVLQGSFREPAESVRKRVARTIPIHGLFSVPVGGYLVPVFPRIADTADPAIFPNWAGATGKAWKSPECGSPR